MSEEPRPRTVPRGGLVEFVRLIFVVLFAIGGFEVATHLVMTSTTHTVIGIVLGTALGYVAGGVLGRRTAVAVSVVEREFVRAPAAEIAAGVAGLVLGLLVAFLLSLPLFRLPPAAAWPTVAFIYLTLPYLGYAVGRSKHAELFSLIGLKPRAAGTGPAEVNVIDTSVLIDGRVLDLVQTGFLGGVLLIHQAVLGELQRIADSSDPGRRQRGRRGLDVLAKLQHDPLVEVALVEEDPAGDVDAALVRLARERGGAVVTVDANLAKVAQALSVPVRSINSLAASLKAPFLPGETFEVRLTRPGRDAGQAVGFLGDGTMVVVEQAENLVGTEAAVTVTNVLQTPTGRMVFAVLTEEGKRPAEDRGTGGEEAGRVDPQAARSDHPR